MARGAIAMMLCMYSYRGEREAIQSTYLMQNQSRRRQEREEEREK